jgi:hypothetical protein
VRRHGLQRVESRSALNVDGAVHLSVGEAKRIGGSIVCTIICSPSLLSETAEFSTWE